MGFTYRNVSFLQAENVAGGGVSGNFISNMGNHLDQSNDYGNSTALPNNQNGLELSTNLTLTRMGSSEFPAISDEILSLEKSADKPQISNPQSTTNNTNSNFVSTSESMTEPQVEQQSVQSFSSKPIMGWEYYLPQISPEEIEKTLSPMSNFLFIPTLVESEQSSSSKPTLARKASQNMKDRIKQIMQYDRK